VPGSGGGQGTGATFSGNYTGSAGTRAYTGYVPSTYVAGTAVPLVVVLHGCTQTAEVMRQLTRFDQLAETKGFIAVYPEQSSSANSLSCWNFFQDAHIHRGAGEPALIAGITNLMQQRYTVDPHRIYVAGLSAGGGMASVMGATYPDVFAAVGVGSGCEYAATATCAGYQSADPAQAAKAAYAEMGSRARPIPVIAFQGDKDTTVPPVNADQLISQWQQTADLADDAAANGSVPAKAAKTEQGQVAGGRSYTVRSYSDSKGGELMQYWLVQGMGHAWSGGCSCQSYSDPQGPDATAAMYAFFAAHPLPGGARSPGRPSPPNPPARECRICRRAGVCARTSARTRSGLEPAKDGGGAQRGQRRADQAGHRRPAARHAAGLAGPDDRLDGAADDRR
jgi:poly(hydroxyalkanoate) depolymerase family esterase